MDDKLFERMTIGIRTRLLYGWKKNAIRADLRAVAGPVENFEDVFFLAFIAAEMLDAPPGAKDNIDSYRVKNSSRFWTCSGVCG